MAKVFFPNLDALRFFAFLSVFLSHSFGTTDADLAAHPIVRSARLASSPGALGVNFFFVLSGFLITFLLLEESATFGKIDLKGFYLRRLLRIWPLYYAVLIVGFIVFAELKRRLGHIPNESANAWLYIVFLGNFDIISSRSLPDASIIGVLWSLSVEEQFYLFWPLLLMTVPNRHYGKLFFFLILAGLVARSRKYSDGPWLAFSTFSVGTDLVIGATLALHTHRKAAWLARLKNLRKPYIAIVYGVGIVAVIHLFYAAWPLVIVSRLLTSLFFAFVIWEQNESPHSPIKFGRFTFISTLGRITYGLYCLHSIGILSAAYLNGIFLHLDTQWWHVVFFETALALGLTVLFSLVSYRWLEAPFLRLKGRLAVPRSVPIGEPVGRGI